jgi:hypothetical protein
MLTVSEKIAAGNYTNHLPAFMDETLRLNVDGKTHRLLLDEVA